MKARRGTRILPYRGSGERPVVAGFFSFLFFFFALTNSACRRSNWYLALSSINASVLLKIARAGRRRRRYRRKREREKLKPHRGRWKTAGNGSEKCISMGALLIYEESLLGEH